MSIYWLKYGFMMLKPLKRSEQLIVSRLKKLGISVNVSLYWSLAAALLNKYVILLTSQEKKKLIAELNTALWNAGLKPVKTE